MKIFVNNDSMVSRQRRPTEAELAILRVLWEAGSGTVRDILAVLNQSKRTGYTTVLKLLQIMTEKGLVQRDETCRPQIYRARYSQEHTQRQLVGDLLHRAFGGGFCEDSGVASSVSEEIVAGGIGGDGEAAGSI